MKLRLLVTYSASSAGVQTTLGYLLSLGMLPKFEADYLHVTGDAEIACDFGAYDVIFHSYCARFSVAGYLSTSYRHKLWTFQGLKVAAVQDEYENTNLLRRNLRDFGFDLLLTCVPPESFQRVYPADLLPRLRLEQVLTGYVPDIGTRDSYVRPLAERPVTIGYRARRLPAHFGRLAFEKCDIGERMAEICRARGISHDISMDEGARFIGQSWFDFISSCRVMLGSESGSNVFDWDGSLLAKSSELTAANGGRPVTYREFLPFVAARDGEVDMGQISPRIFECAALRTPMVLFRGRYSDALTPHEHYIPLEKDFSNIDDVLCAVEDLPALSAMAERAHLHLVGSGRYGYRAFGERLETLLVEGLQCRRTAAPHAAQALALTSDGPADLQELARVQTPTVKPLMPADIQRQLLIPNLPTYLAEIEQLARNLSMQHAAATAELHRLSQLVEIGPDGDEDVRTFVGAVRSRSDEYRLTYDGKIAQASAQLADLRDGVASLSAVAVGHARDLHDAARALMDELRNSTVEHSEKFGTLTRLAVQSIRLAECEKADAAFARLCDDCLKDLSAVQDSLAREPASLAQTDGLDRHSPETAVVLGLAEQARGTHAAFMARRGPLMADALEQASSLSSLEALTALRLSETTAENERFHVAYSGLRQSLLVSLHAGVAIRLRAELGRLHATCLPEARRLERLCADALVSAPVAQDRPAVSDKLQRLEALAASQAAIWGEASSADLENAIAAFNAGYADFCTLANGALEAAAFDVAAAALKAVVETCLAEARRLADAHAAERLQLSELDPGALAQLPKLSNFDELQAVAQESLKHVARSPAEGGVAVSEQTRLIAERSEAFGNAYSMFNSAVTSDLQHVELALAKAGLSRLHGVCLTEARRLSTVVADETSRLAVIAPDTAREAAPLRGLEVLEEMARQQAASVERLLPGSAAAETHQFIGDLTQVFNGAFVEFRDRALNAISEISRAIADCSASGKIPSRPGSL